MTRRPLDGEDRGWQPEQRMTREEVFCCPESRMKDIVPVLTMVGGDVAFTRDGEGGVWAWRG